MRPGTGCQPCRDRHLRCVQLPKSKRCRRCSETDRDCVRAASYRFRPVTSVRLKTDDGRTAKQDLTHDSSQVWVQIPPTVSFVSPDSDPGAVGNDGRGKENDSDSHISDSASELNQNEAQELAVVPFPYDTAFALDVAQDLSGENQHSEHSSRLHQTSESPLGQRYTNTSENTCYLSPIEHVVHGQTVETSSPWTPLSPFFKSVPSWPFHDPQEALLFHHYIRHLAPWIDVCDSQRHFGTEVPRRAAYYPIITNAIFAFASRHLSLLSGSNDTQSPRYLSECLQILIPTLDDPLGHLDENLLAAVVILRLHEEMSDVDEKCHLFGGTRLLNSIASFASDGGLREAASWISLRQHIYISLTSQEPLSIDLSNYQHSSAFRKSNDEAWANRIVSTSARILTYVFQPDQGPAVERWTELEAEVESWNLSKPWYFAPLWMEDPNKQGDKAWPKLRMSHSAHVVAMQYYCLARIILTAYDPRLSKLGFESHRLRKLSETVILKNLRMVVGLAVSNDDVSNAMFQASHVLSACGSYLSDPKEQEAAVEFLTQMQRQIGWRTSHIISNLLEQWQP